MTGYVLGIAVIIMLCILAERCSDKFGIPALILFMFIGMLFGSDGILKISFDDFSLAETACSMALVFIMFYGGFNTKWSAAKPVSGKAIALSTLGVVITAGITTLLCYMLLGLSVQESFLIGAVLSSTDAASVFAILRKNKLNLKDGTASILEVESGSNDPIAYMLTIIAISIIGASQSGNMAVMIILQIVVGIVVGIVIAIASMWISTKTDIISEGLDTIFMIAMVLICFGLSTVLKGNAYLSLYLYGIIIGNSKIDNKQTLIPFFDGVTSLSQILVFFLIGLLSFPHQMPQIIPMALAIVVILTVVARPIAVMLLMLPCKCSMRQCMLISWAGLRGASSCVFAIMAVAAGIHMKQDLFHIVFMVTLFSVAIQGGLLPWIAHKLQMVDDNADVRKTFNDYQEETSLQLMRMFIPQGHSWANKKIKDVSMMHGSLAIMIKRDKETIITKGDTVILPEDTLILSVPPYVPSEDEQLEEIVIDKNHKWCNKMIGEMNLRNDELIALILRDDETIIPDGKTKIHENDVVVIYR
ncbi:MAG: potassium/proton antiporter [Lachnospiraceae bacterium]|nr:potassium/proton antiporter [Lachnospiraceae bacterium]